jgi:hypothetical protein
MSPKGTYANFDNASLRRLPLEKQAKIFAEIDRMGEGSARAQGLHQVITTTERLLHSDHTLHTLVEGNSIMGILKTGVKKLFLRNNAMELIECEPLCVLDFYVEESRQRQGLGRILFEHMLSQQRIQPGRIAYDRPSPKLYAFLERHYSLDVPVLQNNSFAIFDKFFQEQPKEETLQPTHTRTSPSQAYGGQQRTESRVDASFAPVTAPWEHESGSPAPRMQDPQDPRVQPPPAQMTAPPTPTSVPAATRNAPPLDSIPQEDMRSKPTWQAPQAPPVPPAPTLSPGLSPARFSKAQILRQWAADKAAFSK